VAEGRLGERSTSLDEKWAWYQSRSESYMASVATMGKDSIAYHTNVAPVARDILEIVERHGEWREAEVRSKIAMAGQANRVASQSPLDDQEDGMLLEK
jgi:hypothetical protein